MATQSQSSLHLFPAARPVAKKPHHTHAHAQPTRKEELQREVSTLLKMLEHEEKVNKILQHTITRSDGSTIHIPSFLPPKVKELLAELAMVEDEISRLETQLVQLRHEEEEQQAKNKPSNIKYNWHQHQTLTTSHQDHVHQFPNTTMPQRVNENTPPSLDTKALYFISKAIKGDYTMSALTTKEKKSSPPDQGYNEQEEKVSMTTATQKQFSPKLAQRNSATSKLMDSELEFYPPKSVSPKGENNTMQPNKLSESIMKCLIFIFVRLLRSSRASELEKLGTISRSSHASLSSRSFRVDAGFSTNPNLALQKESKQQDPYGIFDIEDSIPRDIGPYKNLVRFTSTSLDPKSISSPSSSPLLQKLRVLMNNLKNVDLRFLAQQQKLAFWINMYNACIMHGFLQYGVPSSQESLLALMKKAMMNVGGNKINALAIENFILRPPATCNLEDVYCEGEEYAKESVVRSLYGLEHSEPNITFALCCGTRSSPAVRIYTANGVSAELEKSKLDYLQAAMVVTTRKRLMVPELLLQNMFDFSYDTDSLIEWICHQLPTSWSLRKSMVECFKSHNNTKISDIVDKMPYDFEFQYLLFV